MNKMNEELAQTALRCAVCHDQCISACPAYESSRQLASYPSRKAMVSREVDRLLLPLGNEAARVMQYCIGCNACLETCIYKSQPNDITPVVRHTRRELFENGNYSAELAVLLANIEKWGNPFGDLKSAHKRLLDTIQKRAERNERILLIGDSSVVYLAEQMAINSIKLVSALTDANIELAQSMYCGWELWHYGASNELAKISKSIYEEIFANKPTCVVTLSPQTAVLLRETYQHELGYSITVPVYSLAEFVLKESTKLKGRSEHSNAPIYLVQSASEVYGTGTKATAKLMTDLLTNSVEHPFTFYSLRNSHYPEGIVIDLHPDPRQVITQRLKLVIGQTKAVSVVVTSPEALINLRKELTIPVEDLAGYLLDQINSFNVDHDK